MFFPYSFIIWKKWGWRNQFLLMVLQISRLDIIFHIQSCLTMCFSCSTNLLVNIPFSLPQQSSPAVLYPSSSHVVCHWDSNNTAPGAFRQDLSNHAKMPHPHQTQFMIRKMRVRSSQSPVSLSLISFYTPDIFELHTTKETNYLRGCPRGVMVKTMVCEIVAREFKLRSRYYVHFQTNTLGKGMNPHYPPSYGLNSTTTILLGERLWH